MLSDSQVVESEMCIQTLAKGETDRDSYSWPTVLRRDSHRRPIQKSPEPLKNPQIRSCARGGVSLAGLLGAPSSVIIAGAGDAALAEYAAQKMLASLQYQNSAKEFFECAG